LDAGFYGQGIYFTCHIPYIFPYVPGSKNPTMLVELDNSNFAALAKEWQRAVPETISIFDNDIEYRIDSKNNMYQE